MERWVGKVAIVTGASSGIGAVIAEALVKAGMQVVGIARRVERVQVNADALADSRGKLHPVKCDVRCENDILEAFDSISKNIGLVYVLINNAAVMPVTNLIAGDTDKWRATLETNILGLCVATREALRIMTKNDIPGQIIHLNSIVGQSHLHYSTVGLYGASKHAVTNVTELLRQELIANKSLKIRVASISPGCIITEMLNEDVFPPELSDTLKNNPFLQCQDVADAILYVLGTPHHVNINEIIIRATGSPF